MLSFHSQHFLYPIDGKLFPRGRGPQLIFSPQLGSCGHLVKGFSWSGGQGVLRNWHQQGKTGYRLKGKIGCRQDNVATVTSSLVVRSPQWVIFKLYPISPLWTLTLSPQALELMLHNKRRPTRAVKIKKETSLSLFPPPGHSI